MPMLLSQMSRLFSGAGVKRGTCKALPSRYDMLRHRGQRVAFPGKPKVGDFEVALAVDQQVTGFEIPMKNST